MRRRSSLRQRSGREIFRGGDQTISLGGNSGGWEFGQRRGGLTGDEASRRTAASDADAEARPRRRRAARRAAGGSMVAGRGRRGRRRSGWWWRYRRVAALRSLRGRRSSDPASTLAAPLRHEPYRPTGPDLVVWPIFLEEVVWPILKLGLKSLSRGLKASGL